MEVIRFNAPLGLQQVAMYGAYGKRDWVLNLWESYQQTLLGNPANIKLEHEWTIATCTIFFQLKILFTSQHSIKIDFYNKGCKINN
jgi:hypothetical protein